ncbi:unnamed protein product, partial [Polarella glacialis]
RALAMFAAGRRGTASAVSRLGLLSRTPTNSQAVLKARVQCSATQAGRLSSANVIRWHRPASSSALPWTRQGTGRTFSTSTAPPAASVAEAPPKLVETRSLEERVVSLEAELKVTKTKLDE